MPLRVAVLYGGTTVDFELYDTDVCKVSRKGRLSDRSISVNPHVVQLLIAYIPSLSVDFVRLD